MNKRELLLAKKIIVNYLGSERTDSGVDKEIYAINHGGEEVLRKYLETLQDIFKKALEQLDEDTELIELLDVYGDD